MDGDSQRLQLFLLPRAEVIRVSGVVFSEAPVPAWVHLWVQCMCERQDLVMFVKGSGEYRGCEGGCRQGCRGGGHANLRNC